MTTLTPLYKDFIDAVMGDPDLPSGVVATPLYAVRRVNFKRARTPEADQWQLAVDVDRPPEDALLQIHEQHEQAQLRVQRDALRNQRDAELRQVDERFQERARTLTAESRGRLDARRTALQARRGGGDA